MLYFCRESTGTSTQGTRYDEGSWNCESAMPTIKRIHGPYRFFFYSFDCNEPEHIHVQREKKVCKYWLRPLALAGNDGFTARELNLIRSEVSRNMERILEAWHEHCG